MYSEHLTNITEDLCQCRQVDIKTKEKFQVLNMHPGLTPTYLFSIKRH